jgi:hypothetical protein
MSSALSQMELLTSKRFGENIDIYSNRQKEMLSPANYYVDKMIETHPALRKIEAEVETAKAEKSVAKAAIWPDLSVVVEKRTAGTDPFDTTNDNDTAVYLSLSASPGAGLSAYSGVQEAEAKVMKLIYEKESKERDLSDSIRFAYNDYTSALYRLKSQKSNIDASSNVMASYKRLFLAGKKQWLDIVNTSRELTNTKIAYSQLNSVLISSGYTLELLAGNIDVMGGMVGENISSSKSSKIIQAENKASQEDAFTIKARDEYYIEITSQEDEKNSAIIKKAQEVGYKINIVGKRLVIGPYLDKKELFDDLKIVKTEVDNSAQSIKFKDKNILEQKR